VANIIYFKAKEELTAEKNLNEFIAHCRDKLRLYEDQGGWEVNTWYNVTKSRKIAIAFSKYREKSNCNDFEPLDEPFMSFAKSYIRYNQSIKSVSSIASKLVALRVLHDALIEIYSDANLLKIDGLVIDKTQQLVLERVVNKDRLNKIGYQLQDLYKFIKEKRFAPHLQIWISPWRKQKSKAECTDAESRKWQETRCPSLHQMYALADCFANAKTPEDSYWSSVLVFLIFAPGRAGELADLTVDCLHKSENGSLGVRWYGEKGFGDTIKWVPKDLENVVVEAHKRLVELGQPARDAAKFAYETPGVFMRHDDCVTPDDFPEDKPLNAYEFGVAMGFSDNTMRRMTEKSKNSKDYDSKSSWNILGIQSVKWIKNLRQGEGVTYKNLADFTLNKYKINTWPNLKSVNRPLWESLILVRDREFHTTFKPVLFSWFIPDPNRINDQITPRKGLKSPVKTLFQRMDYKDEDGAEISLTTHQLRVWLSTNAERQGMDAWQLAQWAGRAKVSDNYHYDLRTQEEREENHRAILELKQRPTPLEALKLNLPVSYSDLGINRVGIADVTEYGMCVHDYTMSPCLKGGECMTCREHVCIKGMPKTLDRIKGLECMVESQFNKAETDAEGFAFGADRWVTHLGWKLAHIRTQRERLESEDISEGDVLWIPPEHDPSPVRRALKQRNIGIEAIDNNAINQESVRQLLGVIDA